MIGTVPAGIRMSAVGSSVDNTNHRSLTSCTNPAEGMADMDASSMSTDTAQQQHRPEPADRWAVLNCAVTQVLGRYATRDEANAAASDFGRCSFEYELTPQEVADLESHRTGARR